MMNANEALNRTAATSCDCHERLGPPPDFAFIAPAAQLGSPAGRSARHYPLINITVTISGYSAKQMKYLLPA